MIRGRYGGTSRRPYVEGRLLIPRLSLFGDISFLVDTGADNTLLMPVDAKRIGLDHGSLDSQTMVQSIGTGGKSRFFREAAVVSFLDVESGFSIERTIDLIVPQDNPDLRDAPSLLGRDVLHTWTMNYDPRHNVLTFDP